MRRARRGRLAGDGPAPATGERTAVLADWGGTRVEEIASGEVAVPVDFVQPHDEWVLVVRGHARLAVGGERFDLADGDWLLLPGGVPHRLELVEPGTRWLAVHAPPA